VDLHGMMQERVDVLHRLDDLSHAHQRQKVASDWNDDPIRRDERVLVHQGQRRRAVEDDDVVRVEGRREPVAQDAIAILPAGEVKLRRRQRLVRREQFQVRPNADGCVRGTSAHDEHVIERLFGLDAERDADVALRVGVDQKDPQAARRNARGDAHGRRGLAGSALVIEDRESRRSGRASDGRRTLHEAEARAFGLRQNLSFALLGARVVKRAPDAEDLADELDAKLRAARGTRRTAGDLAAHGPAVAVVRTVEREAALALLHLKAKLYLEPLSAGATALGHRGHRTVVLATACPSGPSLMPADSTDQ
jgi:hypothetical protein